MIEQRWGSLTQNHTTVLYRLYFARFRDYFRARLNIGVPAALTREHCALDIPHLENEATRNIWLWMRIRVSRSGSGTRQSHEGIRTENPTRNLVLQGRSVKEKIPWI